MGYGSSARTARIAPSIKVADQLDPKKKLQKAVKFAIEALEARQYLTSTWADLTGPTASFDANPNWTPTTGYPNASGAVATMHVPTTVNETISLGANITVGSLTVGSSSASGYSETIASGNTLTFNNGASASALTLSGTAPVTLACSIALAGNLTISVPTGATLTISGNIETAGFTITVNGAGSVDISGNISNSTGSGGGITDEGRGSLTLSGANTYTGTTTVSTSTLILANTTTNSTTSATGTSSVSVSGSGGVGGIIGGTGSIDGVVTFGSYSYLSPTLGLNIITGGTLSIGSGSVLVLPSTAAAMTVGGNIALAGNATIENLSTNTLTLSGGIDTKGYTLTFNDSNSVVVSGNISNSTGSGGGITDEGRGSLTLSGANTYTGTTTVSTSTLILANTTTNSTTSATGTSSVSVSGSGGVGGIIGGTGSIDGVVTFGSYSYLSPTLGLNIITGGTLNIGSGSVLVLPSTAAAMTVGGNIALAGNATIENLSEFVLTLNGNIDTAGHTFTFNDAESVVLSGNISNSTGSGGGITDEGGGSLTLSGSNTYMGTTTVSTSTLILANTTTNSTTSATGTSSVSVSGASGVGGIIGGTGSIDGVVTFGSYSYLSPTLGLNIITGGTLNIGSGSVLVLPSTATSVMTVEGSIALAGNATIENLSTNTLTLSGGIDTKGYTLTFNDSKSVVVSGNISNSTGSGGGITDEGRGSLTLSGSNTYTGITTVSTSTLILANTTTNSTTSATGTSNVSVSGSGGVDSTISGSGTIDGYITVGGYTSLNPTLGSTPTVSYNLVLSSSSDLAWLTTLTSDYSALNFTGNIELTSNLTLSPNAYASLTLSGNIDTEGHALILNDAGNIVLSGIVSNSTGSGSIVDEGYGSLTLSGSNTYSGATTVDYSGLILNNTAGSATGSGNVSVTGESTHHAILGGTGSATGTFTLTSYVDLASATNFSSPTTLASGSILTLPSSATASAALLGDVTLGGNVTVNNASTYMLTLSGDIHGGYGITVGGGGSLTLSGTNSYTGNTTVSAGALILANTSGSATGTGNITIASGATLAGTGSETGSVTVNSGGAVAPGIGSGTGVLTTGSLTLSSGSSLDIGINSATAGSGYDQLSVNGTATISGSSLVLSGSFDAPAPDTFDLLHSTHAISGTFTGIAQGGGASLNGANFTANYSGISGDDILLTTLPTAPSGLTATAGAGQVALAWSADTGASSYNIYRYNGSAYVNIGSASGTSYTDTGLTNGNTYSYKVTAVDAGGEGAAAGPVSSTLVPFAPTGVTATPGLSQVALSWTACNGATGYLIYGEGPGQSSYTYVGTSTTSSYTDTTALAGNTYSYIIFATNAGGTSAGSTAASAILIPPVPIGLAVTGVTNTTVTLAWNSSNGATAYNVLRQISGGSYTCIQTIAATLYPDTTVSANTAYSYEITAANSTGASAACAPVSVLTQLNPPTNPAVTGVTTTSVSLSWSAPADATGYTILREDPNGTSYSSIGTSSTTSYTDTTASAGTTYSYQIVATTSANTSPGSAPVSGTPPTLAPSSPSVTAATSSSISLSWGAPTGATGYLVFREAPGETSYTQDGPSITTNTFIDTSLSANATYSYIIFATDAGGTSAGSSAVSGLTAPAAPTSLTATPAEGQIALAWTAPAGATSYNVYQSTDGTNYSIIGSASSASYTATGLTDGTQYYYKVSAVNSGGEGVKVGPVSSTPIPAAPGAVTVADVTTSSVSLTWSAPTGATGYLIDREAPGESSYSQIGTSTTAAYSDTTVLSGKTYSYIIFATDAGGTSAGSTAISATTLPAAPVNLAGTFLTNTSASLTWSASTGASSYNIYSSTGSAFTQIATDVTTTSFTDTSSTTATTYEISAVDLGGEGPLTGPILPVPSAPTSLAVTADTTSSIAFDWTPPAGATGYVVYREAPGETTYAQDGSSITTANFTDSSLSANGTYSYIVFATDADGTSLGSSALSATTLPGVPSGLAATDGDTQITLNWSAPTGGADSYNVYRYNGSAYVQINSAPVTATTYADTGLTDGANYSYEVSAVSAGGEGTLSSSAGGTTVPTAPSSLVVTGVISSSISLDWTAPTGATGYLVYREASGESSYTQDGSALTTNSFTDSSLSPNSTYSYMVFATDAGGTSAGSTPVSAETLPAVPSSLAATAGDTNVALNWTAPSGGAASYKVYQSIDGTTYSVIGSPTSATFTATGLTDGAIYYYEVSAINTSGEGTLAGPVNAIPLPPVPAAPSGLTATTISTSEIDLAWTDNSSNESGFKIERSTDQSTWTLLTTTAANAASYSDTSLSSATLYYYRVRATNLGGDSANTAIASATTSAQFLLSISGAPLATPGGNYALNVDLSQASNIASLTINWGDGSAPQQVESSQLGVSTLTLNHTFIDSNTDIVTASATNAASSSTNSNPLSVSVRSEVMPSTLAQNISVNFQPNLKSIPNGYVPDIGQVFASRNDEVGYDSSFPLSYGWDANIAAYSGGTGSPDLRQNTSIEMQPSGQSHSWSIALPNGNYVVTVAAGDNSVTSGAFNITANGTTVVSGNPTTTTQFFQGTQTIAVTDGRLTLANGSGAVNNEVDYVDISPVSTSAPAAPSNLLVRAETTTMVTLNWTDNSDNETGFEIDRSSDNSTWTQVGLTNTNATSYYDTATAGATYYYRVIAVNANASPTAYSSPTASQTITMPTSGAEAPFGGTALQVPGSGSATIAAVNFDTGGQNVAYSDSTAANIGGQYRNTRADIGTDGHGGYMVGWLDVGEWFKYTVNVASAGTYRLDFSLACSGPGGTFNALIDGQDVGAALSVPDTGGWSAYETISTPSISLSAGTHVMEVHVDSSDASGDTANCDSIRVTALPSTPPAAPDALTASPAGAGSVHLAWQAPPNASTTVSGYSVKRSDDGGATYNTVTATSLSSTTLNYTDATAPTGTTSLYEVVAVNASGPSDSSNTATIDVPAAGVTVVAPTADAYVSSSGSSGSSVKLQVGPASASVAYLTFDTSAVTGQLSSVVLRLFGRLNGSSQTGDTIDVKAVTDTSWTESGINFSNAPTLGATIATETVNEGMGRWYAWDLTAYVNSQRQAGHNIFSIALQATTPLSQVLLFNSRQASVNSPSLLIGIPTSVSIQGRVFDDSYQTALTSAPATFSAQDVTDNFSGYVFGVGYYAPDNSVIVGLSGGWASPYITDTPYNFMEVLPDGSTRPFSYFDGLVNVEANLAIAQPVNLAGFKSGDLFAANDIASAASPSEIVKITDGGKTVIPNWLTLPGQISGITFDQGGKFGGNLIAVTEQGQVYVIDANGDYSLVANVETTHVEAAVALPDDTAKYGRLAGDLLLSVDGDAGQIYAVSAGGTVTAYSSPTWIDTMAVVPKNENFFGAYGGLSSTVHSLEAAPASQFSGLTGDILAGTHSPNLVTGAPGGIFNLTWDDSTQTFSWTQISNLDAGNWEQFAFGPAAVPGIAETQPGLAGWTVYLDSNNNGALDSGEISTTTDANGNYSFTNLPSGSYTVAEVLPAGWVEDQPTAHTYSVAVSSGVTTSNLDFANHLSTGTQSLAITSRAAQSAYVGIEKQIVVTATDPSGGSQTFGLPLAPDGMTITQESNTEAIITWTPAAQETVSVLVTVQDGQGHLAMQPMTIVAGYTGPQNPNELIASAASASSINLTWLAPINAPDYLVYNVYRGTSSSVPVGSGATPFASGVSATSFTDSNLSPGTTYYYRVTAVDENGTESSAINAVPATTLPSGSPAITAVSVDSDPVVTASTVLHATATWSGGSASLLKYVWTVQDSPSQTSLPQFDATNGTNAAKDLPITFFQPGHYRFEVKAFAPNGLMAVSEIQFDVVQALTSISFDKHDPSAVSGGTPINLTATGLDQFGTAMAAQPYFEWDTSQGTISPVTGSTTAFTAPPDITTATPITVYAKTFDSVVGSLTVNAIPPSTAITGITDFAPNNSSYDFNGTFTLAPGHGSPTFQWTLIDGPRTTAGALVAVQYDNSTIPNPSVRFPEVGTYTLDLHLADAQGATDDKTITVTVAPVVQSLAIVPANPLLEDGGSVQLSIAATDQYGNAMAWSVTPQWPAIDPTYNLGSLDPSGLYTAPASSNSTIQDGAVHITGATIDGLSLSDAEIDFTQPTPQNVTAVATSSSSIALSWDTVHDAHGYEIIATDGTTTPPPTFLDQLDNVDRQTFTINGLSSNTNYTFTVRTADTFQHVSDGYGSSSATTFAVTPVPTALAGSALSSTQIQLTWDNPSDSSIQGWDVLRSTVSPSASNFQQSDFQSIIPAGNEASSPAYGDEQLKPNTNYWYEIVAISIDGQRSAPTDPIEVATNNASGTPQPPTGLQVGYAGTVSGVARVGLVWTPETGDSSLLGYDIYRSTSSTFTPSAATLIGSAPTSYPEYTDDVSPNTHYYYAIVAVNDSGDGTGSEVDSLPSTIVGVYTSGTADVPSAPSSLGASGVTANNVTLKWTDNSVNEAGFEIQRSNDGGADYAIVGRTTQNQATFSDISVTSSTTYDYRVAAYSLDASGNAQYSAWTPFVTVTTPNVGSQPNAPSGVNVAESNSQVTVNWSTSNSSTNTVGYLVYRTEGTVSSSDSYAPNGWTRLTRDYVTGSSYIDATAAPQTTYTYAVRAVSVTGYQSVNSNTASLTTDDAAPSVSINSPGAFTGISFDFNTNTETDGRIKNLTPVDISVDGGTTTTQWTLSLQPMNLSTSDPSAVAEIVLAAGTGNFGSGFNPDGTSAYPKGQQAVALDPTLYPSGNYQLILTATNSSGTVNTSVNISLYSQTKLGNLTLPVTDATFNIPGGQPITITRAYDSSQANIVGDFGYGWTLTTSTTAIRTTAISPPGEADPYPGLKAGDLVYVTLPGGVQHVFQFWPVPDGYASDSSPYGSSSAYVSSDYFAQFVCVDGSGCQLDVAGDINDRSTTHFLTTDGTYFNSYDSGLPFNPANPALTEFGHQYTVTTPDHQSYTVNATAGSLTSQTDANGNTTAYSSSGVAESSGYQLQITRDGPDGTISEIALVNAAGTVIGNPVTYQYATGQPLLQSVTDRAGNTTHYTYDSQTSLLTKVTDPTGLNILNAAYDPSGLLESLTDAQGNNANINTGSADSGGSETTTDLTPQQNTTQTIYDAQGDAVRTIQQETDSTGNVSYVVTVHQYDYTASQLASLSGLVNGVNSSTGIIPQGTAPINMLVDSMDFAPFVISGADAAGLRYSASPTTLLHETTYDTTSTDPGVGMPIQDVTYVGQDANGHSLYKTTTYSNFDDHGKPRNVMQTVDVPTTTVPMPVQTSSTSSTYDSYGNLATSTDPAGNTTNYSYTIPGNSDGLPAGLLLDTTTASGAVLSSNAYYTSADATTPGAFVGSVSSTTNAAGQTTNYLYDPNGDTAATYVAKTWTNADGTTQSGWVFNVTTFDGNGRSTGTSQAAYVNDDGASQPSVTFDGTTGQITAVDETPYNGLSPTTSATTYNTNGQAATSTDQYGGVTTNTYDVKGNLILTTYPDGTQVRTVYDVMGRVIWQTDRFVPASSDLTSTANVALVTHTIYNSLGQVTSTERYQNVAITIGSVTVDGVSTMTAVGPTGLSSASSNFISATQTWYDQAGRTIETENAAGLRTGTIYNPDGSVEYTGVLKDASGTTAPDGGHVTTDSTTGIQTTAFILSDFASYTQYLYNQLDTSSGNPWSGLLYNRVIDADSHATDTFADSSGRTIFTVYDDGSYTQTMYSVGDTALWLWTATFPDRFDSSFLPTTLPTGGSEAITFAQQKTGDTPQGTAKIYDASGNLVDVYLPPVLDADPSSPTHGSVVSPHWQYAYDASGNEISQTDPKGNLTAFTYDPFGNKTSRTLPDHQTETFTYNMFGQQATHTDFDGNVETDSYYGTGPHIGMLQEVEYGGASGSGKATQTVNYTYDALGRQHTVTDASGMTTYGYDVAGNMTEAATPEGTIHYLYDLATGEHTETYTDYTDTQYGYDPKGELTTVTVDELNGTTLSTPLVTTDTFDAVGNEMTETLPDGEVTTNSYDDLNRLTGVVEKQGTTTLLDQQYTLNDDGSRASSTESELQPDGSTATIDTTWTYDPQMRVTGETVVSTLTGQSFTDTYAFDLSGNRVEKTHVVGSTTETTASSYNGDDELTQTVDSQTGTVNFTYDGNGSQTDDGTHKYVYDSRNRLLDITDESNTVTASYVQDDAGDRVQETTGGATTFYLTDTNNPTGYPQPLEERSSPTASPSMTYLIGGRVFGQIAGSSGATVSYLLADGHGSTRLLTGSTGTIAATFNYDAFGNPLAFSPSTAGTMFLYSGQQWDGTTGMYDLRARDYQPGSGRFSTSDTMTFSPGDLANANLYAYVGGNATNMIDPTGHEEGLLGQIGVTGGIAALVAITLGAGFQAAHVQARGVSFNLGIGDEINGLISSGSQALALAGTLMASNTAVVSSAINSAMAKVRGALASLPSVPPIFPIIRSMGPAVYALDVAALATHPWWYMLNYNGPWSPATVANRAAVWGAYGWMMKAAPTGSSLDEFPYASTAEGGLISPTGPAVAAPVPWLQNAVQGGLLSAFYRFSLKSTPLAPFLVVPIPL